MIVLRRAEGVLLVKDKFSVRARDHQWKEHQRTNLK